MKAAPAVALWVAALPAAAWAAGGRTPSALWDDVAHPNRMKCAALLDEGRRQQARSAVDAARAAFAEATALCPQNGDAFALYGGSELDAGDLAAARLALERARALLGDDGGDARLAFQLGFARSVAGELEGSLVEYRRALAEGGLGAVDNWLLYYDLGDDLMALGRLAEAIDAYRAAVRASPQRPMPHLALAVAYDRDQALERSRVELVIALSEDPQLYVARSGQFVFVPPADRHYYLALGQLVRRQPAEARLELRRFLAELPDGPYAARAREQLARAAERVDARELTVSTGVDRDAAAAALGPAVPALERCLDGAQLATVRLQRVGGRVFADGVPPAAAACAAEAARAHLPAAPADLWLTLPVAPGTLDTPRR